MQLRDMKTKILNVVYHEFKPIRQEGNVVLAKCCCCSKSRYAVFIASGNDRIFYYHGYDGQYAQKLFSSLSSRSQA